MATGGRYAHLFELQAQRFRDDPASTDDVAVAEEVTP